MDQTKREIGRRIGHNIALARTQASLLQTQVADRMDVGQEVVSRWENGKIVPPIPQLLKLAQVLGVDPAWLELGCPKEFWTEHALGSFRADALFRMGATPYSLEVERSHNDLRTKMAKYMDTWRDRSVWSEQFA